MIISRSADYALRAMIYLVQSGGSRFVPANEIANHMHCPPFLLSRILQQLVKGGLLTSMKGHHGGFRLRKRPEAVTALEMIRLVDGPFEVFDCSDQADCGLNSNCNLVSVFATAKDALEDVFRTVSLAELSRTDSTRVSMGKTSVNTTFVAGG